MVVSPRCLEQGLASTPLHHQCEGRPPTFQPSRATRAIKLRCSERGLDGRPRGPVTPSTAPSIRPRHLARRIEHAAGGDDPLEALPGIGDLAVDLEIVSLRSQAQNVMPRRKFELWIARVKLVHF